MVGVAISGDPGEQKEKLRSQTAQCSCIAVGRTYSTHHQRVSEEEHEAIAMDGENTRTWAELHRCTTDDQLQPDDDAFPHPPLPDGQRIDRSEAIQMAQLHWARLTSAVA